MIRFGLIGCGRFGKHYSSNIGRGNFGSVEVVCTRNVRPAELLRTGAEWCSDYRDVCDNPSIDCVIVATPPSSHFAICRAALSAGKHVICEKPFVHEVSEAEELRDLADKQGLSLVVNYIHLWNSEITKLFKAFDFSSNLPHFIDFQASCLGPFRKEYSMLWDWYCHDLALLLTYVGLPSGELVSSNYLFEGAENAGILTSRCRIGAVKAHSFVSNLCGIKRKGISITGPVGTLSFEDNFSGEALMAMLQDFSSHWNRGKRLTNAQLAVDITRLVSRCLPCTMS